jgi:hypothetical protein
MTNDGIVTRRQESFVKYRVLQRACQREEWGCVLVREGKGKVWILLACKMSGSRGEVEKATWPSCPRSREEHVTLMSEK